MFHSCGNLLQYLPDLINISLKILEPFHPVVHNIRELIVSAINIYEVYKKPHFLF
ncbi:MAG: hypothetical protein JW997_00415 [Actinobacteria bacterium]|nr:hypothetical protein [Actinomycetota bacterium]